MNTPFQPPAIEIPAPEEPQEAFSNMKLLLEIALGLCALAAVHLVGYAALAFAQMLRRFLDQA